MTVTADVSVPVDTIPPGPALSDTNTWIEFTRHVRVDGGPHQHFRVTDTDDLEAFEAAVNADHRVATLLAIDRTAPQPLYRIEWSHPPPCPTLYRPRLLIERGIGAPDAWWFRIRTNDGTALQALQRDCHEHETQLGVHRIDRSSAGSDGDRYGFTAKQREVLMTAIEEGYFAIPREATQAEIAEALGISDQVVSEHLRRALRKLIRATVIAKPPR